MLKKLLKGLVSASMVLSMAMTSVGATPTGVATGTQTPVVVGDDWGCPVQKTVIKFDKKIDANSVAATDFAVTETKQGYPDGAVDRTVSTREIVAAYTSDAKGNKTTEASEYVTVEFAINPDTNAFYFAISSFSNDWSNPYELEVNLVEGQNLTSAGETINTIDVVREIILTNDSVICPQLEKFQLTSYTTSDGAKMPYAFYKPATDNHKNALVIWNHGAGERGTNPAVPLLANEASNLAGDAFQKVFGGAYVLAIQTSTEAGVYTTDRALELVKKIIAENPDIDPNRVIVGGCSMGGGNTILMIKAAPELFAAAYPICAAGSISAEEAVALKDLPIWFIHAKNDGSVPFATTEENIKNLTAAGNTQIHTSFFDDVHDTTGRYKNEDGTPHQYDGHWSWVYFFNNECKEGKLNCWSWLAQQAREPISVATGTQKLVVTGDDWGCGVSKAVVTLDVAIDAESIAKEDFVVVEEKTWYGTDKAQFNRTVVAAYPCDEAGNKVEGASTTIAIELYISPNDGSPMLYSGGRNNWVSFYNNYVTLAPGATLTAGENTINALNVDPVIKNLKEDRLCPQLDGFVFDTYTDEDGGTTSYALYTPKADNHRNALVMWNHGAGEYGTDVQIDLLCNEVTAYAGEEFQAVMDGAYVLVPQRRSGEGATTTKTVAELIQKVLAENPDIDPTKVIELGCSAGGRFTLDMEIDYPELFAAAAPICPARTINEEQANIIKGIPNWFIHAKNDPTVNVSSSNVGIELLKKAGAEVHMSLFDDVHDTTGRFDVDGKPYEYAGHWSWIYADNNECFCDECKDLNMWEWFAKQQQTQNVATGTYSIVVDGDDWGSGTTSATITLSDKIDDITADQIQVLESKTWYAGYQTTERTVTATYLSDAQGNKVEGPSQYVTVELWISPDEGSPIMYANGRNAWLDDYTLTFILTAPVTSGEKTIKSIEIDPEYTNLTCPVAEMYEYDKFTATDGTTYSYAYYTPAKDDVKNALVIWLHGGGEGGEDATIPLVANEAGKIASDYINEKYFKGAYVLAPQCPTMWMDGYGTFDSQMNFTPSGTGCLYTESLMELIKAYVAANPDIDTNRIYIGGCSNGGYMTMEMIFNYPDYFAAGFPICTGYVGSTVTDEMAKAVKDVPLFFIYAKNDDTLAPSIFSNPVIEKLKAAGNTQIHVFNPDDVHDNSGRFDDENGNPHQYSGHWSWVYAFNDEVTCDEDGINLWAWMNAQAKKAPTTPEQGGTTGGQTGGTTTNPSKPNVGIYNNAAYVAVATIALAGAAYVAFKKKED